MKVTNLRTRLERLFVRASKTRREPSRPLAAAVVTGGLLFSGNVAPAANVIVNSGFEIQANQPGSGWTNQGANYTHPYGGIRGPQLTAVGTLNDYGFNDNLSASAGTQFHGLSFPTSQTVDLVNPDLTAGDILAGEGRFAFSSWLASCCSDVAKVTATFDDSASTSLSLNRGISDHLVTTADVLVNPGGPNNGLSQGVLTDASRRYWALYEIRGVIPNDATQVTITVDDGREDAAAAGATVGGNGNDNYADMMFFDAVQSTAALTLTLEVDKISGDLTIVNNSSTVENINFYEIESRDNSGTLNPTWNSLADQGLDSAGPAPEQNWQEGGGSDSDLLTEVFLFGSTGLAADGSSVTLANGYSGGAGGAEDLIFRYGRTDGQLITGAVAYVANSLAGDFDADLDVDGRDALLWQRGFPATYDGANLDDWKTNFATGVSAAASASATPEPSTMLLVGASLSGLALLRPRR